MTLMTVLLITPVPALAQPVSVEMTVMRDAALAPYLGRAAFLDVLTMGLGEFTASPVRQIPGLAVGDPFFWSIDGQFGAPFEATTVPGGLVSCARYGLETRDLISVVSLSDPAAFAMMRQAVILSDDNVAWPEGAVARLVCSLTWDDARRVVPLDADTVLQVLSEQFADITHHPDPRGQSGGLRVFGPGGYRIVARDGPADSFVTLDLIAVDQLATHQQLRFRSFLMGSGS